MAVTQDSGTGVLDAADILGAFGRASDELSKSFADLTTQIGRGTAAQQESEAAIKTRSEAEQKITTADEQARLKLKKDVTEGATALGTNPDASSYILTQLGAGVRDDIADLKQRREGIQKKADTGFLEDPLGWAINQFTLPADVEAYNIKEAGVTQDLTVMRELMARTSELGTSLSIIDGNATEERLAAVNAKAAAQANFDVANSRYDLAKFGIQALSVRTAVTRAQFESLLQANSALATNEKLQLDRASLEVAKGHLAVSQEQLGVSKEQLEINKRQADLAQEHLNLNRDQFIFQKETTGTELKLRKDQLSLATLHYGLDTEKFLFEQGQSRAHLDLAQATYDLQKEYKDLTMEEKKGNDRALGVLQLKLDNVTAILGMNKLPWQEFKMMTGPMKAVVEKAMMDPNFEQGRIGYNAADTLDTIATINAPLAPGVRVSAEKLMTIKQTFIRNDPLWNSYKPAEQIAKIQGAIDGEVAREGKSVPDQGGIYSPPPLSATLSIPVVKDTLLGQTLSTLGKADRLYPTKASDVWTQAINLVEGGKANPAQMADEITTLYAATVLQNNESHQYQKLALPRQGNFKATVPTGIAWGKDTIDMTNRAEVEAALTRALAKRRIAGGIAEGMEGSQP